jgi:fido (protein-threonine AMPylation protein)
VAYITYDIIPSPDANRRFENWNTAIGLQAVDGLEPSVKLLQLAQEHIEGRATIADVQYQLSAYYAEQSARGITSPARQLEADVVSTNIEKLLESDAFVLSEQSLKLIHKALFMGFDEYTPGAYRRYDFTKAEWVLNGDTVTYEHWEFLDEEIADLINSEKEIAYSSLNRQDCVRQIASFISELWHYHAFREGNTRAVAILAIKYLRSIGFHLNNQSFEKNSLYFRNALVRANYRNQAIGVQRDNSYLLLFLNNVLYGEQYELKNRHLHIYWSEKYQDFSNYDANGVVLSTGA